jgi:hypothetical protein
MKKVVLFVLLSMIFGYYGYSQSLALADSAGPIANNGNVTWQGHNMDDEIVSHIFVRNTTSSPIDVIVKKVEISLVTGTLNSFCWGLCFPPNVYVSPPYTLGANKTDSVDFTGHYNPSTFAGTSVIRYVFYDSAHPSDTVCVNVSYDALYVGISNQTSNSILSGAYPNPANNTVNFNYSLNTENTGTVIIRNLVGSVVKQSVLTGTEGKLSIVTADLPEGIYFYSLDVDGKSMTTRKLIVQH